MVYARHNLGYGRSLLSILCSTAEERWGQCQGVYAYSSSLTSKKTRKMINLYMPYVVMLAYQRTGTGTAEQLDEREAVRAMVVVGESGSLCKIEAMWELWGEKKHNIQV